MADDLILRDGRLADGRAVDLAIAGGLIADVTAAGTTLPAPAAEHDLGGGLLIPAFAEPHAHLDKTLTADRIPNPTGDLLGAVQAWERAMGEGWFCHEDVVERASAALDRLLARGVTAVRTHVNVSSAAGATGVIALRDVATQYRDLLDLQIVALSTPPMTGPQGAPNRAALEEAMAAGADLVGGAPQLDEDPGAHIDQALALATATGRGLDLHIDETLDPSAESLLHLARRVLETGFEGSVTASHCVSLGMQDRTRQEATAREVAAAGISVVTLPHTNLFLQGRDEAAAKPRGLTALGALADAGVVVGAGGDNVEDPYNPVGRGDPLETAALIVMAGHQLPSDALAMVSTRVRELMGLAPVEFEPGDPADLVLLDAETVREAVARGPGTRAVYHRGRLVASSSTRASVSGREIPGL